MNDDRELVDYADLGNDASQWGRYFTDAQRKEFVKNLVAKGLPSGSESLQTILLCTMVKRLRETQELLAVVGKFVADADARNVDQHETLRRQLAAIHNKFSRKHEAQPAALDLYDEFSKPVQSLPSFRDFADAFSMSDEKAELFLVEILASYSANIVAELRDKNEPIPSIILKHANREAVASNP